MIEWEVQKKKKEIADSQVEAEEAIQTINNKQNLEKWLKQGDNSSLKCTWKPTPGSQARQVNTAIKEGGKVSESVSESEHVLQQLSQKEMNKRVNKRGLEEEKR